MARSPVDEKGRKVFTIEELDWFCRNSYNVVIQHMWTWSPDKSLRLLSACLSMISRYPEDMPSEEFQEISLKSAFCNFIGACLRLVSARAEDNIEKQLQHYLELRKHIKVYDHLLQSDCTGLISQDEMAADLQAKLVTLLVFDFEAAIVLKDHHDLVRIVRRAGPHSDLTAYQAMADALLCAKVPSDGKPGPPSFLCRMGNNDS